MAFVLRSIRPRDFVTPLTAILIISLKSLISCINDSALQKNLEGEGWHDGVALLSAKSWDVPFFKRKVEQLRNLPSPQVSLKALKAIWYVQKPHLPLFCSDQESLQISFKRYNCLSFSWKLPITSSFQIHRVRPGFVQDHGSPQGIVAPGVQWVISLAESSSWLVHGEGAWEKK